MKITTKGDILQHATIARIRLNLTSTLDVELFDTEIAGGNLDSIAGIIPSFIARYEQTRGRDFDVKGSLLITYMNGNYHSFETEVNDGTEITSIAYIANMFGYGVSKDLK